MALAGSLLHLRRKAAGGSIGRAGGAQCAAYSNRERRQVRVHQPMKITIDATSALLRSAGVKSYTYHWVRALRTAASRDQIRGYPYLDDFGALDHQSSSLGAISTYARLGVLYLTRDSG